MREQTSKGCIHILYLSSCIVDQLEDERKRNLILVIENAQPKTEKMESETSAKVKAQEYANAQVRQ